MKIAPVMDALRGDSRIRQVLVNTGQHYDESMAGGFLKELQLPVPDRNLGVGSASHALQTELTAGLAGLGITPRAQCVLTHARR